MPNAIPVCVTGRKGVGLAEEVIRGREDPRSASEAIKNQPLPHHEFIIAHLGRNRQEYLQLMPLTMTITFYCPDCSSMAHHNQWLGRSAWSSDGGDAEIPQLQVLCTNKGCRKTHVIIPDFLNPYKRYVGAEIEECIIAQEATDNTVTTGAEESTIRRWRKQFAERLPHILTALIKLLMIEYENMVSLLKCSGEFNRLRELMGHFPARAASTLLGQANLELYAGASRQYF